MLNQTLAFQVTKMVIFSNFLSFQEPPAEKSKKIFLIHATPPEVV